MVFCYGRRAPGVGKKGRSIPGADLAPCPNWYTMMFIYIRNYRMRKIETQRVINNNLLESQLKKLQTSLNNYSKAVDKDGPGYLEYTHVQNDALSVVLSIEKVLLLNLMYTSDEC